MMNTSYFFFLSIATLLSMGSIVDSACPFSALNNGMEYDAETIAAAHSAHSNIKIGSKPKGPPMMTKNKNADTKRRKVLEARKKGDKKNDSVDEEEESEKKVKPGKGYKKFEKWMKKNLNIIPPEDHYIFYVYEGNCKPYVGERDGITPVGALECGYYSWDGSYIGPSYLLCNRLDDIGLIQGCDGHRTV